MYIAIGALGLFVLFFIVGIVTSLRIQVVTTSVSTDFTVTISQLSDTHITNKTDLDSLYTAISTVNEEEVDVFIFTGDLFQIDEISEELEEEVTTLFQTINAPHKLAVLGNHDYGEDVLGVVKRILETSGFDVLINEEKVLTIKNQEIQFIGLDDLRFGNTDYTAVLEQSSEYTNTIVLAHEPDTFKMVQDYDVTLMFSGHSHGGQIRIPGIGSIVNVPGAKEYHERYYMEQNTMLYVSFGTGESVIPLRMFDPRRIEIYKCS